MKIKSGFMIRRFADRWIVVPVDEQADKRNVLITLNKTAAVAWEHLQADTTREALIAALTERFEVEEAVVAEDADRFLRVVREAGLLDE